MTLATLSLVAWGTNIYMFYSYHDGRHPLTADTVTGQIFPSNNHGSIVFITKQERDILRLLTAAAAFFFVIGGLIDWKYKVFNYPYRNLTDEQRYRIMRDRK